MLVIRVIIRPYVILVITVILGKISPTSGWPIGKVQQQLSEFNAKTLGTVTALIRSHGVMDKAAALYISFDRPKFEPPFRHLYLFFYLHIYSHMLVLDKTCE